MHSPKNGMFPIQPLSRGQGNEELTPVGVGATVGHAQYTGPSVLQFCMDLILERFPVDARSTSASGRWIAALDHEVLNRTKCWSNEKVRMLLLLGLKMSERLRLQQVWMELIQVEHSVCSGLF